MQRKKLGFVAVCLGLAVSAATAAPRPEAKKPRQARVEIDVSGEQELRPVFEKLAAALGVELVSFESRRGKELTLRLENVTARTALQAACESLGCRWSVDDRGLSVSYPPRAEPPEDFLSSPVTISLADAELGRVLGGLANLSGLALEMDEALAGRQVTLEVHDRAFGEAMDELCAAVACSWSVEERDGRTTLRLVPAGD